MAFRLQRKALGWLAQLRLRGGCRIGKGHGSALLMPLPHGQTAAQHVSRTRKESRLGTKIGAHGGSGGGPARTCPLSPCGTGAALPRLAAFMSSASLARWDLRLSNLEAASARRSASTSISRWVFPLSTPQQK